MDEQKQDERSRTWTEEIEVAGGQLIEKIKALIAEGNVREVRVKAAGGRVIFEMPLTVGVLAGGAVALAAPWLAVLGAIAALVARVKLEVVREADDMAAKPPAKRGARKAASTKAKAGTTKRAGAKPKRASSAARKSTKAKTSRRS